MNNVRLYYIKHQGKNDLAKISEQQIEHWLSELSSEKKSAVQRLLHISDRMASLLATRLLKMCAVGEGLEKFCLADVDYPEKGKPGWQGIDGFMDFNVSHSDNMIVVAVSREMNVGVDIEKIRLLKRLNFKMVLSEDELNKIQQKPELFFDVWSKKEAVVKAADTVGIGRMRDVVLKDGQASLDEAVWHLKDLDLDSQYVTYLATSKQVDEITVKQVAISDLYL